MRQADSIEKESLRDEEGKSVRLEEEPQKRSAEVVDKQVPPQLPVGTG